jgi:nucleoside 2-deoxyribosyltransferase
MIITICSSVDFSPKLIEIKKELERLNHQVNVPYFTQKMIDGEVSFEEYMAAKEKEGGDILLRKAQSMDMIKRYWDFISNSDAILVLNLHKKGIDNYIGGSVLMEMGFAYGQGKAIFMYNPIPLRSERIHYVDEIMDMKPIVINKDLTKIICAAPTP